MPGLQSRQSNATIGAMGGTTGPTGKHRKQNGLANWRLPHGFYEVRLRVCVNSTPDEAYANAQRTPNSILYFWFDDVCVAASKGHGKR